MRYGINVRCCVYEGGVGGRGGDGVGVEVGFGGLEGGGMILLFCHV